MSTETLRLAAALMAERAEAATQPEWAEWHTTDNGRAEVFVPNGTMDTATVFEFKDRVDCEECVRPNEADLLHLASWHPRVALAVAGMLASCADQCDHYGWAKDHPTMVLALATARAYLGEPS